MEIVDAYHRKIIDLEHQVLLKPSMAAVRQCESHGSISNREMTPMRLVHIISGDLILRKRTLGPIKSLVYAIRRYDADRVAALYNSDEQPNGWKAEGYMSGKTRTYLADVFDNMEHVLASIEMFAGISENLINYSFNVSFSRSMMLYWNIGFFVDVVARDESSDENIDYGHHSVCAADGSRWLFCEFNAPFSGVLAGC